ncbi:MAG: hypothetical protein GJ680_05100 [Alteromonadaceae bacterium]|nr:hypothetical protein [Alteromonadaceae bacterium]
MFQGEHINLIKKKTKLLRQVWGGIFLAIVVYFIFQNQKDFTSWNIELSVDVILLVLILEFMRRGLGALKWAYLYRRYEHSNSVKHNLLPLMRIHFISSLALYIPGGVWFVASKLHLTKKLGYSYSESGHMFAVDMLLTLWMGLAIGAWALSSILGERLWLWVIIVALLFTLSIILGVIPARRILPNKVKSILNGFSYVSPRIILTCLCFAFINFLTAGAAIYILMNELNLLQSEQNYFYLTSLFALAWSIGFLSVFSPNGIGVREGILVMGLGTQTAVMVVILCLRLLSILPDILWFLITYPIKLSAKEDVINNE